MAESAVGATSSEQLAERLAAGAAALLEGAPRVVVAVDGPDASGKTTLADAVARALGALGSRASVDGFHAAADVRRRRGPLSPVGFYEDAFDLDALEHRLLRPFRAGERDVAAAVHDVEREKPVDVRLRVPEKAVLVVDGLFLLRARLVRHWDLAVHLLVEPDEALRRARRRDVPRLGTWAEVEQRYRQRYLPAHELYRAEAAPADHAHVVVDNTAVSRPRVVAWRL